MKKNISNDSVKIYLLIITLISIFLPCKAEKNIKIIFHLTGTVPLWK